MKKRLIFFLGILVLLSGCSKNELFKLNDEYYNNSDRESIDNTKLQEMEDNKDSFLLFFYTPGCTSCQAFSEVLDVFQQDYNIKYFMISNKEFKENTLSSKVKYSPSLMIFKEGKMVAYLDAESDNDLKYYKSIDNLVEWLEKYIYLEEDE